LNVPVQGVTDSLVGVPVDGVCGGRGPGASGTFDRSWYAD
jgi:hypothetical protein